MPSRLPRVLVLLLVLSWLAAVAALLLHLCLPSNFVPLAVALAFSVRMLPALALAVSLRVVTLLPLPALERVLARGALVLMLLVLLSCALVALCSSLLHLPATPPAVAWSLLAASAFPALALLPVPARLRLPHA